MKKYIIIFFVFISISIFPIEKEKQILLCPKALNNPFWFAVENGMKDAAKDLDIDFIFDAPLNIDSNEQFRFLVKYIENGIKGLGVSPIDPIIISELGDTALKKMIPFITFDSDISNKENRLLYIGTDNYSAGKEAAKLMIEKINSKKSDKKIIKIAILTGSVEAKNLNERIDGFREHILNVTNRDFEVILLEKLYTGNEDTAKSIEALKLINIEHPDIDCIFMAGAWALFGKEEKYVESFSDINNAIETIVVSFDTLPNELELLKKGYVDGLIGQKPYDIGYLAAMVLYNINKFGVENTYKMMSLCVKDNNTLYTELDIVTDSNVDKYIEIANKIYNRK
ncbi:MAG: sugar ABC transporter substrate-binding protein [Fusobacteria bacterium]|nr:sugar ABC transporter substrate-binding protein [Fusobacteriota bacterium]